MDEPYSARKLDHIVKIWTRDGTLQKPDELPDSAYAYLRDEPHAHLYDQLRNARTVSKQHRKAIHDVMRSELLPGLSATLKHETSQLAERAPGYTEAMYQHFVVFKTLDRLQARVAETVFPHYKVARRAEAKIFHILREFQRRTDMALGPTFKKKKTR